MHELDLHLTERTHDFACTCLVTEVLAPAPVGRIWVANHVPRSTTSGSAACRP